MMLPFINRIKGGARRLFEILEDPKEELEEARRKRLVSRAEEGRTPSAAKLFPGELAEEAVGFGEAVVRGAGRAATSVTLSLTGKEKIKPETVSERLLWGDDPIYNVPKTGYKTVKDFGFSDKAANKAALPVGVVMAGLDIADIFGGGGKKEIATETFETMSRKYGDDLAKQIVDIGGSELAEKSIIKGGSDAVKRALDMTNGEFVKNKLISGLKSAEKSRAITERLFTKERGKRAAAGARALEELGGTEEAFNAALKQLKGELPKADYESIKDMFGQKEIDSMFKMIQSSRLNFFDKITTRNGLTKALGGEKVGGKIPTHGEMSLMEEVFGPELINAIRSKDSLWNKVFKQWIPEIVNLPRSLMTSGEMSAILRQGVVMAPYKPKIFLKDAAESFKYTFKEDWYKEGMRAIEEKPMFDMMNEAGLSLTKVAGETFDISKREEEFMSRFAEKIPLLGKYVKASERGYVGFLNKLRADVFEDVATQYMESGINPKDNGHVYRGLADMINVFTGRGKVPAKWSGPMSTVFFSPRFQASRLQALNPVWYARHSAPVRKEAMKAMGKFVASGLSILGLAKLSGAEVGTDPTSADFNKIKLGNMRIDMWAGYQQWMRLAAQLSMGELTSSTTGKKYELVDNSPIGTKLDRIISFGRGKLAPVPSLAFDLLDGKNILGEDVTFGRATAERMTPIYIQSIVEAYKEEGLPEATATSILGFFGIGVQTYGGNSALPSFNTGGVKARRR